MIAFRLVLCLAGLALYALLRPGATGLKADPGLTIPPPLPAAAPATTGLCTRLL